ncbi:MAG: Tex family protein [Candidatus Faecisoma sp.]|nr:RNA-binding transcriptional accessory protein [Acholeplasma sp.]MDY2892625.1 Tex family protein [Candidatus Faecisoma sp.]CCY27817.1 tex-like protein [Acholeplasma sp. CAG:878]
MNKEIIITTSNELGIKPNQVEATLKLLMDGNTVPFIARYRKEATGALNEEEIRAISEKYEYQVNLLKRKEDVIRLIDEKGLLNEELKQQILNAKKLVEIEDLYRPYKEKKKTKATDAINNGLEPLAKKIMSFPITGNLDDLTKPYINEKVVDSNNALLGASYIIAEWISDNANYRKWMRSYIYKNGIITTKKKKDSIDLQKTYEMYYDYSEKVKEIKPHRILAINRAEKEKIINVSIVVDEDEILDYLSKKLIKNEKSFVCNIVFDAIKDSYKRLIFPSVEREIRSELTEKGEIVAIDNFSKNLEKLLLQPPMKQKVVLGFDPAYRTGCKLAVLDSTGQTLKIEVIYPHEPVNKYEEAKKTVLDLINQYNIDIIAIGNGTASRESEAFIADVIKDSKRKVEYIIVSEAGASVYSASKIAIEEFPTLTVEKRSAISIGRRLQDPLSELVKIEPESIGVGLYQHDVNNKKLTESLDFVVSSAVNKVGVDINTASPSLFKYVSGITKKNISKIIEERNKKRFKNRLEVKKILSSKTYEQSIGFLRVTEGDNMLDVTSIHPESYNLTLKLLDELNLSLKDMGTEDFNSKLNIDLGDYAKLLNTDKYTLEDIIECLKKPNRDPRDSMPKPLLKSDILHIEDLKVGMKLQGTVRNVVDFGVFIDIGLKNDGLAHISKLTDKYIKHPMEVVSVGDIVDCYVSEINLEKNKVSLSLKEV